MPAAPISPGLWVFYFVALQAIAPAYKPVSIDRFSRTVTLLLLPSCNCDCSNFWPTATAIWQQDQLAKWHQIKLQRNQQPHQQHRATLDAASLSKCKSKFKFNSKRPVSKTQELQIEGEKRAQPKGTGHIKIKLLRT